VPASRTLSALVLLAATPAAQTAPGVSERVAALTRATKWTRVAAIAVAFPTFHPQGMVKVGDAFLVSSVEVHDREAGKGVGHLFKIAANGALIADRTLGEGTIYHPGGIDFDGQSVWVPVAEYRPDSRTIVYRVDPQSMKATEVLRVADHIGAVVYDTDARTLHGISWGSRRFYQWTMNGRGEWPAPTRRDNVSHYLDYQDCKYVGHHQMACGGVTELRASPDSPPFRLGGIDLVDLNDGRPVHQSPVLLWTPAGLDMTHNPVWFEAAPAGLRAYFMPEDDRSTIYVYESASP
jgi:hypothetical protein